MGACVGAHLDAGGGERAQHARKEVSGDALVHEQRLGGVAHAGSLRLGVEHDRERLLEVGAGVDVDVAVAGGGVDDGHGGDRLQRLLEPLAAARDDQVDGVALRGELGELLASAAGDEAHAAVGQPGGAGRLGGDLRERGVGVRSPRRSRAGRSRCRTSGTARRRRS